MDLKPDPMALDMAVYWSEHIWDGDPDGDITLEYDGYRWLVKKDIIRAQFPRINMELARREPVRREPGSPVQFSSRADQSTRPSAFAVLLGYLHTNVLPARVWEDAPSFLTFVEIYFLADRFGIERLKANMVASVEDLSRHVLSLTGKHCSHCALTSSEVEWEEKQHLTSFLHAVLAVEERRWSARMVKAMYDAGDRMKKRLMGLPDFCEFVERYSVGRNFGRAIGVHRL